MYGVLVCGPDESSLGTLCDPDHRLADWMALAKLD